VVLAILQKSSAWKKWPLASRLSRSLKVIGTDTDRSATYDFLLNSHSNNGPISPPFPDKRRFQLKIAIFSTPVYFEPPLKMYLNWRCICHWISALGLEKKLERREYRVEKISLTISSAVQIRYTNVTDGQTDRHRMIGCQKGPGLRIASRGKSGLLEHTLCVVQFEFIFLKVVFMLKISSNFFLGSAAPSF